MNASDYILDPELRGALHNRNVRRERARRRENRRRLMARAWCRVVRWWRGPDRGGDVLCCVAWLAVSVLVPVKDYDAFVGGEKSAARGVATIEVDGRPRAVATRFGQFALLSQPGAEDKLKRVRRMLQRGKGSLASALSAEEKKLATTSPLWLYTNVEKASAIVKPMVFGKLE